MKRILVFVLIIIITGSIWAQQRSDRSFVRHGNRLFQDSLFIKAEENYLKAVDINPELYEGVYNLGNAYTAQQKPNEAVEQYRRAANTLESRKRTLMEDPTSDPKELNICKDALAKTYHNTGVVYHMSEQYDKAVESYKQALRNNPDDDETRYNMILAQRMLKQQQQEQQQQKQEQEQQQQQEQQQNEEQQEEQQQQQQEQPEEMSQENAEQILDAAMQDEKDVQDRVMEQLMKAQPKKPLEKDW